MYFPLFVGLCFCLCFGMHYFVSFLFLQSRKTWLVALLLLSYGCLVTGNGLWLFLTVPWVDLQHARMQEFSPGGGGGGPGLSDKKKKL